MDDELYFFLIILIINYRWFNGACFTNPLQLNSKCIDLLLKCNREGEEWLINGMQWNRTC